MTWYDASVYITKKEKCHICCLMSELLQFSSDDSFTVIKQDANATKTGRHLIHQSMPKDLSRVKGKVILVLNQLSTKP
jgi:hypothetical protein